MKNEWHVARRVSCITGQKSLKAIIPRVEATICFYTSYYRVQVCSAHHNDRPTNTRDELLRQKEDTFIGEPADRRWQASASKELSYGGLDARFFYRLERKKRQGTNIKRQNRKLEAVGK